VKLAFEAAAAFALLQPNKELRSDRLRDISSENLADDAPIRK